LFAGTSPSPLHTLVRCEETRGAGLQLSNVLSTFAHHLVEGLEKPGVDVLRSGHCRFCFWREAVAYFSLAGSFMEGCSICVWVVPMNRACKF
jgi:hypothetical protein